MSGREQAWEPSQEQAGPSSQRDPRRPGPICPECPVGLLSPPGGGGQLGGGMNEEGYWGFLVEEDRDPSGARATQCRGRQGPLVAPSPSWGPFPAMDHGSSSESGLCCPASPYCVLSRPCFPSPGRCATFVLGPHILPLLTAPCRSDPKNTFCTKTSNGSKGLRRASGPIQSGSL